MLVVVLCSQPESAEFAQGLECALLAGEAGCRVSVVLEGHCAQACAAAPAESAWRRQLSQCDLLGIDVRVADDTCDKAGLRELFVNSRAVLSF